jgi:hypothetical protein
MPDYAIGTAPPNIKPDVGSGAWCSDTQTAKLLVYKRGLEMAMDSGATSVAIGAHATRHMRHYMNNTGNGLRLDLAELVARSAQLKQQYEAELAQAKAFVQTLRAGRHLIRSTRTAQGYFRQSNDRELFFAIGGYSYWGTGEVLLTPAPDDAFAAELHFTFEFYDRYNWDGGKKVEIAGVTITDEFMQRFHRECYAREYDLQGQLKRLEKWLFKPLVANPFERLSR